MDEVCVWCGEDVGHEPDCPEVAMDAMQQHIEELTEEREEALLVMRQIEEALRHGFSVEPGSFLHDEVTRLCSGGPER